jgi:hypothetical protein
LDEYGYGPRVSCGASAVLTALLLSFFFLPYSWREEYKLGHLFLKIVIVFYPAYFMCFEQKQNLPRSSCSAELNKMTLELKSKE